MKRNGIILLVVIIILILAGVIWVASESQPPAQPNTTATSTSVSTASSTSIAGWLTYTATSTGTTFQYPPTLSTTYINTVDWPPMLQELQTTPFTCTAAGTSTEPAGHTEPLTVNGNSYCVTTESEGAAGSIYTTYAYAFPKNGGEDILTFSLRYPQCANYTDSRGTECTAERTNFNIGSIVDQIAQTVQ